MSACLVPMIKKFLVPFLHPYEPKASTPAQKSPWRLSIVVDAGKAGHTVEEPKQRSMGSVLDISGIGESCSEDSYSVVQSQVHEQHNQECPHSCSKQVIALTPPFFS